MMQLFFVSMEYENEKKKNYRQNRLPLIGESVDNDGFQSNDQIDN